MPKGFKYFENVDQLSDFVVHTINYTYSLVFRQVFFCKDKTYE